MAIIIKLKGKTAHDIVDSIDKMIESGEIRVWEKDDEGDYTHSSSQWREKSWFRRILNKDDNREIKFGIIGNKHVEMTRTLYAIYHGRFTEMLLTYFDRDIEEFRITPMKDPQDSF